ncbi:MAG: hypothetical protein ACJAUV_001024 [Flavobacteriales bacterium]|jgi:hypothetical protein
MKRIFTIAAALMMTASAWAQSPEKMSYQAVVRDASNALVTNQAVGMQISILQTTVTGTAVYAETQTPTTNANGLVSLEIGVGTVVSGDFSTIDWANGPYFIKTETDPTGGTTYTITGTSQLMSVPYALHSKTAESITGTVTYTETDPIFDASLASGITGADTIYWNNKLTTEVDGSVTNEIQTINRTRTTVTLSNGGGTFTDSVNTYTAGTNITISPSNVISATGGSGSTDQFYLGQDTLGGIVYYIYKDATGAQHGLIVNKTESIAMWQASFTTTNANRSWDGAYNTSLMTNSEAATYVNGLGAGWYLPSIDELSLLWESRFTTNKALNAGAFTLLSKTARYWSSTEYEIGLAYNFLFAYAQTYNADKDVSYPVRAVRAF